MQGMKRPGKLAAFLQSPILIVALAVVSTQRVSAQGAPSRLSKIPYSPTLHPTSEQTKTYFEFPFQKLKEAVPELKGLKFDDSQERLTSILSGVGRTIANVLPRFPFFLVSLTTFFYHTQSVE